MMAEMQIYTLDVYKNQNVSQVVTFPAICTVFNTSHGGKARPKLELPRSWRCLSIGR